MVFLKNNPFTKLLQPLILGICLQFLWPINKTILVYFLLALFIATIVVTKVKLAYQLRHLYGLSLFLLITTIGMFLTNTDKKALNKLNENELILHGYVTKVLTKKHSNYSTEIIITAVKNKNIWYEQNEKAIALFEPDSNLNKLKAGQELVFKASLLDINDRPNPFGFDYKHYLSLKNIHNKLYIKSNQWEPYKEKKYGLRFIALNLREQLIQKVEQCGIQGDNLAVLSALVFGYKDKLDEKIRKAYSGAGAMHVLAVSGLHVSIVFFILKILLYWLKWFKKSKKIKAVIIVLGIWTYAFLTGLSPSVMRASVMFSFIIGGQLLDKKSSIFNSLAASAFILLLINPKLLFDIGFQLSYSAVTGIILLQPKIKGIFFFPYKLLNWAWQLTAVSIAAQISTFPITVYHFHEFPTYFWLSNIAVSLAATALISITFLLLAFSSIPTIANILSVITKGILYINHYIINQINTLPGYLIQNINLHQLQVIFIYITISALIIWLIKKQYSSLIAALFALLVVGIINIYSAYSANSQNGICMYHTNQESSIHIISKNKATWFLSKPSTHKSINYTVKNANTYWRTINSNYYQLSCLNDTIILNSHFYCKNGFWKTHNRTGLLIHNNSYVPITPSDTLKLDYIFVSGNPTFSLKDISKKITYKKVIIDGSVPHWKTMEFSPKDKNNKIHLTKQQGAFIDVTKL